MVEAWEQHNGASLVREFQFIARESRDIGSIVNVWWRERGERLLPYAEKAKLDVLGSHLAPDGPPPRLNFFARNGFDDALARDAETSDRIRLISPQDLFPARAPAAGR